MDNEGLIKITGHPLILFGEKSKNLRKRRNYIKFFNKKYYLDKKWKLFRKENNCVFRCDILPGQGPMSQASSEVELS